MCLMTRGCFVIPAGSNPGAGGGIKIEVILIPSEIVVAIGDCADNTKYLIGEPCNEVHIDDV